jgi:hypothetical protein
VRTPVAMAISAVLSLPLLVLHVSRFTDIRFALGKVLPLAVFTTGIVIIGVYGDQYRAYAYIAAVTLVVGYVTVTFRRWSQGRQALKEKRIAELRDAVSRLQVRYADEVEGSAARLTAAIAEVNRILKTVPESKGSRIHLKGHRSAAESLLEAQKNLKKQMPDFLPSDYSMGIIELVDKQRTINNFEKAVDAHVRTVDEILRGLGLELEAWKPSRPPAPSEGVTEPKPGTADKKPAHSKHCIACGAAQVSMPYCSKCGTHQPVVIACVQCDAETSIPVHLLVGDAEEIALNCTNCGASIQVANPLKQ